MRHTNLMTLPYQRAFLTIRYPIYFFLCIIKIHMGVSVQCYTDVCVTHDILQGFRIHTGFCHIRAKGVPAYMWMCQV